ncbi:MAG: protein-export chaperone SecB [Proteobacteria bacterium]|nr:protein-export chaperone SecB [Pseudomonadota bacterium]
MATDNPHPNGPGPGSTGVTGETSPHLSLQTVYLKDCSYEAPNGPRVDGEWNPQFSMDLNTQSSTVAPDVREVVLTVTVDAKQGDKTAFLVEVKQAGLFLVRNLGDADQKRAIGSVCPNVLFPYARAVVSQLVTQGGFPQFVLPAVNFDALYNETMAEAQRQTVKN